MDTQQQEGMHYWNTQIWVILKNIMLNKNKKSRYKLVPTE